MSAMAWSYSVVDTISAVGRDTAQAQRKWIAGIGQSGKQAVLNYDRAFTPQNDVVDFGSNVTPKSSDSSTTFLVNTLTCIASCANYLKHRVLRVVLAISSFLRLSIFFKFSANKQFCTKYFPSFRADVFLEKIRDFMMQHVFFKITFY